MTNMSAMFEYKDDTVEQKLFVKQITDDKILFTYCVNDKNGNNVFSFSDSAKGNTNQDVEIDEDEDGTAYGSIEYWPFSLKNHELSVRLDLEQMSRAYVRTNGKLKYANGNNIQSAVPIESKKVMTLKTGKIRFSAK